MLLGNSTFPVCRCRHTLITSLPSVSLHKQSMPMDYYLNPDFIFNFICLVAQKLLEPEGEKVFKSHFNLHCPPEPCKNPPSPPSVVSPETTTAPIKQKPVVIEESRKQSGKHYRKTKK